ncbi:3-phenylpropionate/trans-cinnamate dioxygenase ferredoxin reductase subunit [Catenulispora sp. MAP12-49]|uniref:NAD(P)/FAD-dependent oxidoreductase n=1 Tax=Catenulispora sp. MAP12-49 TaxID=3156302 RepID=UPI0035162414
MRSVAVVGASLAGLSTVRTLRAEGYEGSLTIIGAERHEPYDRPPLSKEFLKGGVEAEALALGSANEYQDLDVRWVLGRSAVRLDPRSATLTLDDGRQIRSDAVVIATGATPRTIPGSDGLRGIHTLRTLDDAVALRADLVSGRPRVVVIGAGFIGAEVASTAHALGLDVTVVEAMEVPLERALGREMGRICSALHTDHGVRLLCGVGVSGFTGAERVEGVLLDDGRLLPADVVVAGIGVTPATAWLAGSGVEVGDGVLCDAGCATSVPNVVAVGDIANCPNPFTGRRSRIEHWTHAMEQPKTAVRTLLSGSPAVPPAVPPYFWSDQYHVRIQLAGHVGPQDEPQIVEGDVDSRSFVAVYRRAGKEVAVLGVNQPKLFNRLRRSLQKQPGVVTPGRLLS